MEIKKTGFRMDADAFFRQVSTQEEETLKRVDPVVIRILKEEGVLGSQKSDLTRASITDPLRAAKRRYGFNGEIVALP